MAAKNVNTTEEVVEEVKTVNPNEELVTILLPRKSKSDPDEFIYINERRWQIQRGVEVQVPKYVAKAIRLKEKMEAEAYEFEAENQK